MVRRVCAYWCEPICGLRRRSYGAKMEFWAGVILGAIAGWLVDRLWQIVEDRVRLDVDFTMRVRKAGFTLQVELTNVGKHPLQPHKVWLYSPYRGAIAGIFEPSEEGVQYPGQTRLHSIAVGSNGVGAKAVASWMERVDPSAQGRANRDRVALRLVVVSGKKILYQNVRLGTGLAQCFVEWSRPCAVRPNAPLHLMELTWRSALFEYVDRLRMFWRHRRLHVASNLPFPLPYLARAAEAWERGYSRVSREWRRQ